MSGAITSSLSACEQAKREPTRPDQLRSPHQWGEQIGLGTCASLINTSLSLAEGHGDLVASVCGESLTVGQISGISYRFMTQSVDWSKLGCCAIPEHNKTKFQKMLKNNKKKGRRGHNKG